MADNLHAHPEQPDLSALLRSRALRQGGDLAFRELRNDLSLKEEISYGALDARTSHLAARLRTAIAPGERALIFTPTQIEYLTALFACARADVIAVSGAAPYAPSARGGRHASRFSRLRSVLTSSGARAVLGPSTLLQKLRGTLGGDFSSLIHIATDVPLDARSPTTSVDALRDRSDTIAMLQYTSGSTNEPRGVILRHRNLMANLKSQAAAFEVTERDIGVSWLPLYHDLGLISGCLLPLFVGFPCTLMPAASFAERPLRWLTCISQHHATISWAPAFAYRLCAVAIPHERRAGLDLSAWRVALTGAEPVPPETARMFSNAFAKSGLSANAFYPCYGLAEATLAVTAPTPGDALRTVTLDKAALGRDVVSFREPGEDETMELTACGRPVPGLSVAIVDPESCTRRATNEIGEIWITGPNCSEGYFGRDSSAEFHAHIHGETGAWLRTGDLGFLARGQLVVTGRLKDIIVVRGINYYPQDFERTAAESSDALSDGGACAIPSLNEHGEESLAIICEIKPKREAEARTAAAAVRRAIHTEHNLETRRVIIIRRGAIPRTPSGKIQRRLCRALLADGALEVVWDDRIAYQNSFLSSSEAAANVELWVIARLASAATATQITPTTTLADLGLTSLQIIEMAEEIEARFGRRIPIAELFELQSPADIVARLTEGAAEG